jgi:hypothetical protein
MHRLREHLLSAWSFVRANVWLALSAASGAPSVIIALYVYWKGKDTSAPNLLLFLMGCSVVTAWLQWNEEHRKRLRLERTPRPQLSCSEHYVKIKSFRAIYLSGQGDITSKSGPGSALRIFIENNPETTQNAMPALQVLARLSFLDDNGRELFNADGWWPEDITINGETSITYRKVMDLPVGVRQSLELVFKFDGDISCYGMNDESRSRYQWQNPDLELPTGQYRIVVHLFGKNIDDRTFNVRFENPGFGELLASAPLAG